jgi:hypothetical protein
MNTQIVGGVHIKNIFEALKSFFVIKRENVGEFHNKYIKEDGTMDTPQLIEDILIYLDEEKYKYFNEIRKDDKIKTDKIDIFKDVEKEDAKKLKQTIINQLFPIFNAYFKQKRKSIILLRPNKFKITENDQSNNFTIEKYLQYLLDNLKKKTDDKNKEEDEARNQELEEEEARRNQELEEEARNQELEDARKKKELEEARKRLKKINETKKEKEKEKEKSEAEAKAAELLKTSNEEVVLNPIEEEKVDDSLQKSLFTSLNNSLNNPPKKIDNSSLQKDPITEVKDPITEVKDPITEVKDPITEVKDPIVKKDPIEYPITKVNNPIVKKDPIVEDVKKDPIVEDVKDPITKVDDFIRLIIKKTPTNEEDNVKILEILKNINSYKPEEIDEIGNTHFHYIAGSFYEQKQEMFASLNNVETIRSFYNYQNAEGTTPLMILFSKCDNIEDLQKINEVEYVNYVDDIEQEDIYGNSIFSILTKKIVEFSEKEEIQINDSSNFIEKIIQNKITIKDITDIPKEIGPIDPLENTALHYVAGSFLSMEDKMKFMNNETFKDQLNYQNIEGTTPLMILIKHMTKKDLNDENIRIFIVENIEDLEQEDIYGNSIFSILTKKIVEISGAKEEEYGSEEKDQEDEIPATVLEINSKDDNKISNEKENDYSGEEKDQKDGVNNETPANVLEISNNEEDDNISNSGIEIKNEENMEDYEKDYEKENSNENEEEKNVTIKKIKNKYKNSRNDLEYELQKSRKLARQKLLNRTLKSQKIEQPSFKNKEILDKQEIYENILEKDQEDEKQKQQNNLKKRLEAKKAQKDINSQFPQ